MGAALQRCRAGDPDRVRLARWWDVARLRARSLARRPGVEAELERELQFHIEQETAENFARGMRPEDARAAALRRLGGVAQVQEECRDMRRVQYFEQTLQDLRYALRSLGKAPGFTTVIVLTLALAIGANSAIFSVIEGVLLKPLPYSAPDRLVRIFYHNPKYARFPFNHFDLRDIRGMSRTLSGLAGYTRSDVQLSGAGDPIKLSAFRVTAGFFGLLGLHPAAGRDFTTVDELPDARVAILSDRVWRKQFGATPDILGRKLLLDARPFTVVGVMPPGTDHPGNEYNPVAYGDTVDLWIPFTFEGNPARRGAHYIEAIGRMKPGVTVAQAQSEVTALLDQIGRTYAASKEWTAIAVPLQREIVGSKERLLLVLLGAVGLVLLIACVNAANLLLARATARQREIAVRTALGAGRGRLIRQMLTESLLLALAGGVAGALLAVGGIRALVAMLPAGFPRAASIALDGGVFAYTFLIAAGAGVVFGLVPAIQAARFDIQRSLREGGRGSTAGGRQTRLRSALVTGEVALACVLMIGAGLLLRSFLNLLHADPGFRPQHVLTATVSLPTETYRDTEAIMRFYEGLVARVESLPGVQAAGAGSDLPWTGWDDNAGGWMIEGGPESLRDQTHARYHVASADYFRALGIPLLRGRFFTSSDTTKTPNVLIVNRALAERYWPGRNPVGSRITFDDHPKETDWITIVGVVGDVKDQPNSPAAAPGFWWPATQMPWSFNRASIVLRAAADPGPLAAYLRSTVRSLDGGLAVADLRLMDQIAGESYSTPRFTVFLLGLFAALALALAATGIYGVIAYTVSQRMHEFGMRIALGAGRGDVLRLVLGQGVKLAAIGIGAGLIGGAALSQLLGNLLYGVKRLDPATFVAVAAVALGVAVVACYVPALRATGADPMQSLRSE
jgi:predicted permease